MKLLHIDSSARRDLSISRKLTAAIVHKIRTKNPGLELWYRDLDKDPISHLLSSEIMGEDEISATLSEEALKQFLDADILVLGAPMYNFSIPSTLKAWIDRLAVKGKTFRYTQHGPEGLLAKKTVFIVLSSGGEHTGGSTDFAEPYLRLIFEFFGITNLNFIRVGGVDISVERREESVRRALESIHDISFSF